MSDRARAIALLVEQVPGSRANIETGGNPSISAFQALRAIEAALSRTDSAADERDVREVELANALLPFARMQFDNNFDPAHYSDGIVLRFEATVGEIRAARAAAAKAEEGGLIAQRSQDSGE